jgi:hypothetical protein
MYLIETQPSNAERIFLVLLCTLLVKPLFICLFSCVADGVCQSQNNLTLLLIEQPCSDNQHWCSSLDEIVYEDRANNAAVLSEHIQIVMFALRKYSEQARIAYTSA